MKSGPARLITVALLLSAAVVRAQDAPSFAEDPVIVEYDVDTAWPERPEHVSRQGWVSGMAIDGQDQIWLFRKGPDPVQVYTPEGKFVRSWGKGSFEYPHHLRIDPEGNVWIADFGQHIVQKYTPDGKLLMTLGVPGESGNDEHHFYRPTDMVVAPSGDIFVTDGYGNRRVVHFNREGRFLNAWGEYGTKPGQFVLPHAIAIDSKGILYVCDRNSGRIMLFKQDGSIVDQWTGILMPWGIYISPDDDIWVCGSSPHWWKREEKYTDSPGGYPEYKDQLFVRFSTDGKVRQLWTLPLGDIGTNKDQPDTSRLRPGETVGAHCIVRDSQGNVYVGDIYGERAQKFVPVTRRATGESAP